MYIYIHMYVYTYRCILKESNIFPCERAPYFFFCKKPAVRSTRALCSEDCNWQ